jgi:hypothetical protein
VHHPARELSERGDAPAGRVSLGTMHHAKGLFTARSRAALRGRS